MKCCCLGLETNHNHLWIHTEKKKDMPLCLCCSFSFPFSDTSYITFRLKIQREIQVRSVASEFESIVAMFKFLWLVCLPSTQDIFFKVNSFKFLWHLYGKVTLYKGRLSKSFNWIDMLIVEKKAKWAFKQRIRKQNFMAPRAGLFIWGAWGHWVFNVRRVTCAFWLTKLFE